MKKMIGLALLCGIYMLGSCNICAANNQTEKIQNFYLDGLVVTATGSEENLFNTHANMQVVTKKQIETMHYKDVKEALRSVPGIQFLDYGQAGHESSSSIRINGSDNVVVMVDGIKMNIFGTTQSYLNHIVSNMADIERIEVLKGSAAVLYGSDAKGGVINIITKKASKPINSLTIENGNFGYEKYKVSSSAKIGKTSYKIYAEKYLNGDFEDGNGQKWDNYQNGHRENIVISHEFSADDKLTLSYTHGDEDFAYYNIYGTGADKETKKGYTKTENFIISSDNKFAEDVTNKFTYNYIKFQNVAQGNNTDIFAANVNNRYENHTFSDVIVKNYSNHDLSLGLEYLKAEDLNNSNYELENQAVFLQDEWKFDDKWKLTSGLRYDKPESTEGNIDSNLAKSFNVGYTFDENTNMYLAYNDYFVLPTMGELYSAYGNPNLNAEKGKNYEFGINHKFDDNNIISSHVFYRNSDRIIGYDYSQSRYANIDQKIKAHGFDVQYDKFFDEAWHANVGYSFIRDDGETTGYLPKNIITLGVDYSKEKWQAGMNIRSVIGRNGNNINYSAWPKTDYTLVDLSVNYKPQENLKAYFKVNNLFDTMYAERTNALYGSPDTWYGMPGRSFVVGMEYSF